MRYDLVIKNGTLIDGSGAERRQLDVAITDGKIVAIEPDIPLTHAAHSIDADGLNVAPGAIDLHTHFDAQIHWDPYCSPHSSHGVTSALISGCGFGYAPVKLAMRERTMAMMETTEQVPVSAQREALPWGWETYPEWLDHLDRLDKGLNVLSLLPLNPLFIYVMGIEDAKTRRATRQEMDEMKAHLREAMLRGAAGFAFSRLGDTSNHTDFDGSPMPMDVHPEEDIYELAGVLKELGQGIVSTTCSVPGSRFEAIAEGLARASGRPVVHLVCGPYDAQPEYHREIMAWLDRCAEEGLKVYSMIATPNVQVEFNITHMNFWERDPAFRPFVNASNEEKIRMAGDPAYLDYAREAYRSEILGGSGGPWEGYVFVRANGADRFKKYEGQRLDAITAAEGGHVVDVLFAILHESELMADFRSIGSCADPEKCREVLVHPRCLPGCSDGGAHIQSVNLLWSSEFLGWAVRDHHLCNLEELHRKYSAIPAEILGLEDRGEIAVGKAADIMVYDLQDFDNGKPYTLVRDIPGGDYRRAAPPQQGIRYVIVNGAILYENGLATGALPGQVVRLGSFSQPNGSGSSLRARH